MAVQHREWEIGRHLLRFEPPDVLRTRFRGGVCLQEAMRMVEVSRELGLVQPFFMVGDMTEAGLPEPEARRYLSEHLRFEWITDMIYIRARLAQRAAAKGILLAAYLTEYTMDAHVVKKARFVSTPEEAEALIVQLRAGTVAKPHELEMDGTYENGLELPGPSSKGLSLGGGRRPAGSSRHTVKA